MDARIRLEGRLETVERAVQALSSATRAPGDYQRLAAAIDQMSNAREAEQQVMKLAREDSSLRRLLDGARRAKERAASVVFARADVLGMPHGPLLDTARAVASERVRFEARVRNPWMWLIFGTLGALWAFAVVRTHSALPVLVYGAVGALMIGFHFASTVRVIVTAQRLVLGKHRVPLHEIERIDIVRLLTRSNRPYRVTLHTRDGLTLEQRVAWIPGRLITALRAEGVSTRQATPYFFPG